MKQKNELIKIITDEEGKRLVSARELYDGLGMDRKNWSKWYPRNIENNEFFTENQDWCKVVQTTTSSTGQVQTDFAVSLEFAKHLAMMSKTEKSHEYRQYFIQCEKQLQEVQDKSLLLLQIYNGGTEGVIASKKLTEIEIKEATKPLVEQIEEEAPLVSLAKKRLDKTGTISITEATKTFDLKRGAITNWAKEQGYIHKTIIEVNKSGEVYFKLVMNGDFKSLGILEEGIKLINDNLQKIKDFKTTKKKKQAKEEVPF